MTGPAMIRKRDQSRGPSRAFPSLAVGLSHHATNKTINPFRAGFIAGTVRGTGVRNFWELTSTRKIRRARSPHSGTRPGRNFPGSKSLASLPRRCRNSAGCNIARHLSCIGAAPFKARRRAGFKSVMRKPLLRQSGAAPLAQGRGRACGEMITANHRTRHFSFNRTNRPFAVAAASGQIIADLNNRRFHESQRTHGGFASAQTFVPIPEEQNANHG